MCAAGTVALGTVYSHRDVSPGIHLQLAHLQSVIAQTDMVHTVDVQCVPASSLLISSVPAHHHWPDRGPESRALCKDKSYKPSENHFSFVQAQDFEEKTNAGILLSKQCLEGLPFQ